MFLGWIKCNTAASWASLAVPVRIYCNRWWPREITFSLRGETWWFSVVFLQTKYPMKDQIRYICLYCCPFLVGKGPVSHTVALDEIYLQCSFMYLQHRSWALQFILSQSHIHCPVTINTQQHRKFTAENTYSYMSYVCWKLVPSCMSLSLKAIDNVEINTPKIKQFLFLSPFDPSPDPGLSF